ncbi:MAG: hypothetical protein ACK5ZD_12695 [Hyphomonadaceae bacterium]|jgi:hypothetical protein
MTETAILAQAKNPFLSRENGECFGFALSTTMASRVPLREDAGSGRGTRIAALHGDLGAMVDSGKPEASHAEILSAVVSPSIFLGQLAHFGSSNFQAHHISALNPVCSV